MRRNRRSPLRYISCFRVRLGVEATNKGGMVASIQVGDVATDVRPFQVEVAQEDLDDLRRRIAETRWPSKELVIDRSQGVQRGTLKELARYWASNYDWSRAE